VAGWAAADGMWLPPMKFDGNLKLGP